MRTSTIEFGGHKLRGTKRIFGIRVRISVFVPVRLGNADLARDLVIEVFR